MTTLNVGRIMNEVRAALQRRGDAAVHTPIDDAADAPVLWNGAIAPSEPKLAYALDELLAYSDREFVENAYRVILRRASDPEGLRHYLGRLRSGGLTKVEVLGELRWSREGLLRSVHVDGLLLPYRLQQLKRRRFIGPLVAWLHGVARLGTTGERMAWQEARVAQVLDELGRHVNRTSLQLSARITEASNAAGDLKAGVDRAVAQIERIDDLTMRTTTIRAEIEQLARLQREAADAYGRSNDRLQDHTQRLDLLKHQIAGLDELTRQLDAREQLRIEQKAAHEAAEEAAQQALDPLYVAFERQFRGSPELIEQRAQPYLEILREANVGGLDHPVLDIGSGNGEWLDVLRRNGFSGRGVDSNRIFADMCRGRGLDVQHGDALEYLRALPDGSLGAITAMHVAEHLPFEVLIQLLDEARRVLCIGGVIALETPNPENILVGSHYFYMDPTHRNPIPPEALRWVVEARGFQRCRIERWTVAREISMPPLLPDGDAEAATINAMLAHFRAALDYAVVGRRL